MNASFSEIRVPHETVNDDSVVIAGWRLADGEHVTVGEVVVEIETSKTVLEIAADTAGRLEIVHPVRSVVAVGEVIGRISRTGVEKYVNDPLNNMAEAPTTQVGGTTLFSDGARRLLQKHGLDETAFPDAGLVRERDVRALLEKRENEQAVAEQASSHDVEVEQFAKEAPTKADRTKGPSLGLMGDARLAAQERGRSLVWVAWNYFWRNWFLGLCVRVAPRGIILPVHRMRGVRIGRDCFVDPSATLETAYPERITLGDDVRIAAGVVIMTHIKAPNLLRQSGAMPAVHKPVQLKSHSFVGVNAVVMPGVTIGKGSVVASGAVVTTNVPDFTMVAGNPAKAVRKLDIAEEYAGGGGQAEQHTSRAPPGRLDE